MKNFAECKRPRLLEKLCCIWERFSDHSHKSLQPLGWCLAFRPYLTILLRSGAIWEEALILPNNSWTSLDKGGLEKQGSPWLAVWLVGATMLLKLNNELSSCKLNVCFLLVCAAICQLLTKGDLHNGNLCCQMGTLGRPPPWPANGGILIRTLEVDNSLGKQTCPL